MSRRAPALNGSKHNGALGGRILLAEDDPELGAPIELRLTRAGSVVTRTETAHAAVSAAVTSAASGYT